MNKRKSFILNYGVSIFSQVLIYISHFIIRKKFIEIFGAEVLGYYGTFSNILNLLNLSELGIGYAINYKLYEALARKDYTSISSYMEIYKKFYTKVIIAILVGGGVMLPFLPLFVKKSYILLPYLAIIFSLQLLQTLSSYMWSYRKIILRVTEQNYINGIVETISGIGLFALQYLAVSKFQNYYYYLLTNTICILTGNIVLHQYIGIKNSEIFKQNYTCISHKQKELEVKKDLKDIIIVKLGGYVLNSTDFLVISVIMGSLYTGLISNYSMVFISIQNMVLIAMDSVQAIIGNSLYTRSKDYILDLIIKFTTIIGLIAIIFCPTAYRLIDDFIGLWIGKAYIQENIIALFYSINVFLMFISNPISLLFGSLGYYKYDKKIILSSAVINITLSVILVYVLGMSGVLLGTTVALLIYWFSRLFILRTYYWDNIRKYVYLITKLIACLCVNYILVGLVDRMFIINSWLEFIAKGILMVLACFVPCILYYALKQIRMIDNL